MPKRKTTIIIFFEKKEEWHDELRGYDVSRKAGNMLMNRFSIDEETGSELSGIYLLKDSSPMMRYKGVWLNSRETWKQQRELVKDFQYSNNSRFLIKYPLFHLVEYDLFQDDENPDKRILIKHQLNLLFKKLLITMQPIMSHTSFLLLNGSNHIMLRNVILRIRRILLFENL